MATACSPEGICYCVEDMRSCDHAERSAAELRRGAVWASSGGAAVKNRQLRVSRRILGRIWGDHLPWRVHRT